MFGMKNWKAYAAKLERDMQDLADELADAQIGKHDLQTRLDAIAAQETPGANATVKRMAAIARGGAHVMNRNEAPSWLTGLVLAAFAVFVMWCWIAAAPSPSIYVADMSNTIDGGRALLSLTLIRAILHP
jgi:hypothetical protein